MNEFFQDLSNIPDSDSAAMQINTLITELTQTNTLPNKYCGPSPQINKPNNVTCIWNCNVNGYDLDRTGGKLPLILAAHNKIQADISTHQEINIDTTQHQVCSNCQRHLRGLPSPHLTLASSKYLFGTSYKAGGTAVLSTGPIAGRRLPDKCGSNEYDRWSFQTFRGSLNTKIKIVSCYQVTHRTNNNGSTNAHTQQEIQL